MAVQPPPERFDEAMKACVRGFGGTGWSPETAAREATVWEADRTWVVEDNTPHLGIKTVTVTVVPQRTLGIGENRVARLIFYCVP